jgi:16S rRNA processing protein RimM
MAYNNNILLGKITKLSGFEGAVAVRLEEKFIENIPQMESVFLEIEGRPVPFFISGYEYSGTDILKLMFDGYNSIEKVNEFVGCRVFLTTIIPDNDRKNDHRNMLGFSVFTHDDILLGSISEIIFNNGQWLLDVVSDNKKGILIPFHEHLIISIDLSKKTVFMDIPDGLLDIN